MSRDRLSRTAGGRARRADPRLRVGRRADRGGHLGAVRDPGLPNPRERACGRRWIRWRSPTSTPSIATRARFWSFYRPRFADLGEKRPNGAHEVLAELEARGLLDAVITQNIDRLHGKAGSDRVVEVHGSIASSSCTARAGQLPARSRRRAVRRSTASRPAPAVPARSSPTSCSSASYCPRRRWPRPTSSARRPTCCSASARRSRSTRSPGCPSSPSTGGADRDRHPGADALRPRGGGQARRRRGHRAERRSRRAPGRPGLSRARARTCGLGGVPLGRAWRRSA